MSLKKVSAMDYNLAGRIGRRHALSLDNNRESITETEREREREREREL
jgi:hypothetical protein